MAPTCLDLFNQKRRPGSNREPCPGCGTQCFDAVASRDDWHYVNFTVTFGTPQGVHPPAPGHEPGKILQQLPANLEIAKNGSDARARAIALCWVFHLTGDVHQPLHVVALFSDKAPGWRDGDKGGNEVYVLPVANRSPTKLHSYWDGIVTGTNEATKAVHSLAVDLTRSNRYPRAKFSQQLAVGFHPDLWAQESLGFARTVASDNGNLPWADDPHSATVSLASAYVRKAKSTARSQICLAGHRLADVLRGIQ